MRAKGVKHKHLLVVVRHYSQKHVKAAHLSTGTRNRKGSQHDAFYILQFSRRLPVGPMTFDAIDFRFLYTVTNPCTLYSSSEYKSSELAPPHTSRAGGHFGQVASCW